MNIDMSLLTEAFKNIEDVGQGEKTFSVGGAQLTLRVLRPSDEIAVQRWSGDVLSGSDGDESGADQALEYLDKFRTGVLSYSIIAIGDLDLRGVEFIPSDDIRIPKHEALRGLIEGWTRTMLLAVFKCYVELTDEIEKRAGNLVDNEDFFKQQFGRVASLTRIPEGVLDAAPPVSPENDSESVRPSREEIDGVPVHKL